MLSRVIDGLTRLSQAVEVLSQPERVNVPRRSDTKHPFMVLTEGEWIAVDYRNMGPTTQCPCGATDFIISVRFDDEDRAPVVWFTTGACAHCGALLTVPTPVDLEDGYVR